MFNLIGSLLEFAIQLVIFIVSITALATVPSLVYLLMKGLWGMITKAARTAYSSL